MKKPLPSADSTIEQRAPSRKKTPSAKLVFAQAQAKVDQADNIEPIASPWIKHGVHAKTGLRTLTAVFPFNTRHEPQHLDLSFLLDFQNLEAMFAAAYLQWGAMRTPSSRLAMTACLSGGFFHYVRSRWSTDVHPHDIDDEFLSGFRTFLLTVKGKSGKTLQPRTSASYLGSLRSLLVALTVGPWSALARNIASRVPPGPNGAVRKSSPVEVLGLADLLSIIEAAEREILAISLRFEQTDALLTEGRKRLQERDKTSRCTAKDYADLCVCLAALDQAYPGIVPDLAVLQAANRPLGSAVQYVHGQSTITSYFYPSFRHLVPFVLLLSITTVFNADTVLGLNWKDIAFDKEHAGYPAIEIIGTKNRAAKNLVRLLDPEAAASSQLSLKQLLLSLQRITARIRPLVSEWNADRLFIGVQSTGPKKPRSYGDGHSDGSLSGDITWMRALQLFIEDNKLPSFTLGQLRPTILDLVHHSHGTLEAAQKVGNHRSAVTTWTHYTSSGIKKRYRERIGQVLVMRERWLESKGVLDPRRLEAGQDKGAATPGFTCLDPFNSPRPGQQSGKLCKDYGGCPSCPLAAAHPHDPISVAYYVALEQAIYRSQAAMNSKTWLERWVPILVALKALRELIPEQVLVESYKISITLMNVE